MNSDDGDDYTFKGEDGNLYKYVDGDLYRVISYDPITPDKYNFRWSMKLERVPVVASNYEFKIKYKENKDEQ